MYDMDDVEIRESDNGIHDGRRFFSTYVSESLSFALDLDNLHTRKIGRGLFVNDAVPGKDFMLEEFKGDLIKNSVYIVRCARRRGGYGICVDDPDLPLCDNSNILDCRRRFDKGKIIIVFFL